MFSLFCKRVADPPADRMVSILEDERSDVRQNAFPASPYLGLFLSNIEGVKNYARGFVREGKHNAVSHHKGTVTFHFTLVAQHILPVILQYHRVAREKENAVHQFKK